MKKTRRYKHSWTRTKIQNNNVQPLLQKQSSSSSKNPNVLDIISELPDDILAYIISLLPFREATATRILSTRWRRLHSTANVVSLTCPFPLQHKEDYLCCELGSEAQFSETLNLVNHTLNSYKGSNIIKKFRVEIPYIRNPNSDSEIFDKLLEFALSRETEIIDIRVYTSLAYYSFHTYYFSTSIISESLGGLKCVKELSLYGISFYNDHIRVLLLNLVALERLVIGSSQYQSLHVYEYDSGYEDDLCFEGSPACKLRHLIISNMSGLGCICVGDLINLVSLKFDGIRYLHFHDLSLYNLPKLVHLRVGNAMRFVGEVFFFPNLTSRCKCFQLQRLDLFIGRRDDFWYRCDYDLWVRKKGMCDYDLRVCKKGKHLELSVVVENECNLHLLFPFIEAWHGLKRLEIKLIWLCEPKYDKQRRVDEERVYMVTNIDYLNTIKVTGFCGTAAELEFVLCVLNNGLVLQELSIEGCATKCKIQQKKIAHSFNHLISVAPSSVDLILK